MNILPQTRIIFKKAWFMFELTENLRENIDEVPQKMNTGFWK